MSPTRTPQPDRPRTILVLDADPEERVRICSVLERAGFTAVGAASPSAPDAPLQSASMLLVHEAIAPIVAGQLEGLSPTVRPIVVVRGQPTEASVTAAYARGCDDFVSASATDVELIGRVRGQLRSRDSFDRIARKQQDAQAMLELTQALASSLDFSEIMHTVVRRIADVVNVDRASIVLAPDGTEALAVGYVVATSDDREIANLQIELDKYPEIVEVLKTRQPLTIADTATHPVLDGVRESVPDLAVGALTLFPIVWQEDAMGVLFLRSAIKGALNPRETDFCRIVANTTAVALRNARVMQSLRDQTQKVNYARFEAERRLRALKRYANLFTSAADGLAAVDQDGRMLFANPRAYEIAGIPEEEARGHALRRLVHPSDQSRLLEIWRRVRAGDYPHGVDLRLTRPDGTALVVSCSFSALLESEGAVLLSFRDVTLERGTAADLVQTKDFLESLIEASVDAIIAATLDGKILLFNSGAERIYGYEKSQVIGKRHVTELYPEGGAKEVMRLLRSPSHGGEGRLSSIRFDAVDCHGTTLPIMLSAAIIYDDSGAPFATVGIFTDLREKLRTEERLAHAQQKLAVSEKQALIAELA
ncbi:MAG TPA: PAS domain S-box protein, partial [Polyangiaceae bacterium]|nr:PAS domain S-box protein [Polyangiaceae bacterium]